jgi:hypothetical protein
VVKRTKWIVAVVKGAGCAGRPSLSKNLRALIVTMALENPSWGDPRTIGKHLKQGWQQRWATFLQSRASAVAARFFTSATATFQGL